MKKTTVRLSRLSLAVIAALFAMPSIAQNASEQDAPAAQAPKQVNPSDTSNTTTANDSKRAQDLDRVVVKGKKINLGGGLMSYQSAPKAVSTISRDAIEKAAPGSNFTQAIESIPGVNTSTDDVTGLSDGNYSVRGFTASEVGVTVNGAPISDSGSYSVYATEYGDTENYGDITVEQGIPDLDQPDSGAAGGHIAWATINPSHKAGLDFSQSLGSHNYERTFLRFNTGDTGPVRSWISYSYNRVDKWRGNGDLNVYKIDGKSIWEISDGNSITASFQFNHQIRDSYFSPTKAQVAQHGYFYDYDTTYAPGSLNTNFYALHVNPFKSYVFSLDGEFTLTDNLHLSVIPYFQYGDGNGSGAANFFSETTSTTGNQYEFANQDLNQDGHIVTGPNGKKALAYDTTHSKTWRPGIIVKFKQDLGLDNSLEYGMWYERPRQEQSETWQTANFATGMPDDIWGNSHHILYPDGQVQRLYDDYTKTETQKYFVTDTWTPSDKWLFSLGAAYLHVTRSGLGLEYPGSTIPASHTCSTPSSCRVQFGGPFSASYNKVTPALGIKFSPDKNNQFYYGVGKTFRAPPNGVLTINGAASDVSPTPLPAYVPESAWNNDIGWRFYNDRLAVNLMLYHSNFSNRTIQGFDQNSGQSIYLQIPRLKMQGFDAEASFNLATNWKLYGSYTYTQATMESDLDTDFNGISNGHPKVLGDGNYPTKGKQLFNTPRNIAYVALDYDNGPFWAGVNARYRSSIYGDFMNTESVGGYTKFGLNAGYRFRNWDSSWFSKPFIKFNIANITNRHAFTNANNAAAFLASNPTHITDENGVTLFASAPYYSLLEPRTYMVTFGASFF